MLKRIHRWLGLGLCVTVFIISITGVLLVWKKEYLWVEFAEARQDLKSDTASIANAIDAIERHHPDGEIRSIQIHHANLALYKVFLTERRYAWHDQNGRHLQVWSGNVRLEDFLLDLHHRFLLGNTVGLNIAGFSGLLLLPLILLGISLWWPRRRTLKLGLWPSGKSHSSFMRSHSNLGAISLIPILVVAITGVILVYPNEASEFLLEDETSVPTSNNDTFVGQQHYSWERLLQRSLAQYPEAEIRWVSPPSADYSYRIVGLQQTQAWNPDGHTSLTFQSTDGQMHRNSNAQLESAGKRLFKFSYPLHTASLGLWYRLLMTSFGLAMALICIFGVSSYLKR